MSFVYIFIDFDPDDFSASHLGVVGYYIALNVAYSNIHVRSCINFNF